jgi:hypothetical protein
MTSVATSICLVLLVSAVTVRAQSNTVRPGPEYDVLNAWAGYWVIQGEVKETPSGSAHKLYWTLKGERILGGFFLQVRTTWKAQGIIQNALVITGYDPAKKTCTTHGYNDDGSWLISTPTFIDERTCIENGSTHLPDGKVLRWRNTWNFSADGKSLSVKGENEKDGTWWTRLEAKGVKDRRK